VVVLLGLIVAAVGAKVSGGMDTTFRLVGLRLSPPPPSLAYFVFEGVLLCKALCVRACVRVVGFGWGWQVGYRATRCRDDVTHITARCGDDVTLYLWKRFGKSLLDCHR
jgi:hypothetical protein